MRNKSARPHYLLLAVAVLLAPVGAGGQVRPGEVITAENHELVRNLMAPEFYHYAVESNPDLEMHIVESGDYTPHAKYVEATARYACQAELDEKDG